MEESNVNVEILDGESIVELTAENNKTVKFREIACIEYEGKFYELLQPVELFDDMEEDEAFIFECVDNEETGDRTYNSLFDEKLLEAVFNEYLKAVSEYNCDCCDCEDDCDCDCGCEDEHEHEDGCGCGHHHHHH